jgi:heat shock protein HspQ
MYPGLGTQPRVAKYRVGDVVKHRFYPFRGIIFDIDPVFASTEEWWQSIPEDIRPSKSQPFYHLLAENDKTEYVAYVSEQNLVPDTSGKPLRHPQVADMFVEQAGAFQATFLARH